MPKPPTTHERLASVETEVRDLKSEVQNHVISRLNAIDKRLWGVLTIAIGTLAAALVAALR